MYVHVCVGICLYLFVCNIFLLCFHSLCGTYMYVQVYVCELMRMYLHAFSCICMYVLHICMYCRYIGPLMHLDRHYTTKTPC